MTNEKKSSTTVLRAKIRPGRGRGGRGEGEKGEEGRRGGERVKTEVSKRFLAGCPELPVLTLVHHRLHRHVRYRLELVVDDELRDQLDESELQNAGGDADQLSAPCPNS